MNQRFLLYIDILGFTDLVATNEEKVRVLYTILDKLNVHKHNLFDTIVFSDTILVYNKSEPQPLFNEERIVMYSIEFAQDLLYRLIGSGIYFRGLLIRGEFDHYHLKNVECFFGSALISAYQREKLIPCTGLFIHDSCQQYNIVFDVHYYNDQLSFVYLNKPIERFKRLDHTMLPLRPGSLADSDLDWIIVKDCEMFQEIYRNMKEHPDSRVRQKFQNTWKFWEIKMPKFLRLLVDIDFSPARLDPTIDWNKVYERCWSDSIDLKRA